MPKSLAVRLRTWAPVAHAAPALLVLLGGVVGVAVSIVVGKTAGAFLGAVLPLDPSSIDPLEGLAGGVGFVALALGLLRRKRLAWWLAITILVAWLVQPDSVQHPVAAALAVGCLVVLAADRRRYRIAHDRRAVRPVLAAAILIVGVAVLWGAAFDIAGPVWADAPARLRAAVDALGASLWLGADALAPAGSLVSVAGDALDDLARLALVAVAIATLRALPGPVAVAADPLRARSIARRYATGALRPFQLGEDKRVFSPSGHPGAIVYGDAGRFAVALGDPLGRPTAAREALREFAEACEIADRRPAAYQVSDAWRPAFERVGFRTFAIGAEAILDLDGFGLGGAARANLRHTASRAARGGVRVEWHPDGRVPPSVRRSLAEIDAEWRRAHRGPELGFTIHGFDAALRVPIAIAFEADGTPSAFATFQRTGPRSWVLDLLRRRRGTPGALESCIVTAALALAEEGGETLSLGLAPLARLRPDGPLEERLLARLARVVGPAYDVRGLEFFKAKFDPRWEPRFVAVRSRADGLGIALALLRLHVAGSGASVARVLISAARA